MDSKARSPIPDVIGDEHATPAVQTIGTDQAPTSREFKSRNEDKPDPAGSIELEHFSKG